MKTVIASALATLLMAGSALAQSAYNQGAFTSPATAEADMARVNGTLNATETFTGRFTQTNSDGTVDGGRVYIQRPGKLRFEYDGPLLVVSDGVTLVQHDKALETTDRVPLAATPLDFFLKNDVDLLRDTEVVAFQQTPSEWRVSARDGSGQVEGTVTLVFDANTLALKSWIIDDTFGAQTRVDLSDLRYNAQLDPRLFVYREDNRRDRRR